MRAAAAGQPAVWAPRPLPFPRLNTAVGTRNYCCFYSLAATGAALFTLLPVAAVTLLAGGLPASETATTGWFLVLGLLYTGVMVAAAVAFYAVCGFQSYLACCVGMGTLDWLMARAAARRAAAAADFAAASRQVHTGPRPTPARRVLRGPAVAEGDVAVEVRETSATDPGEDGSGEENGGSGEEDGAVEGGSGEQDSGGSGEDGTDESGGGAEEADGQGQGQEEVDTEEAGSVGGGEAGDMEDEKAGGIEDEEAGDVEGGEEEEEAAVAEFAVPAAAADAAAPHTALPSPPGAP